MQWYDCEIRWKALGLCTTHRRDLNNVLLAIELSVQAIEGEYEHGTKG